MLLCSIAVYFSSLVWHMANILLCFMFHMSCFSFSRFLNTHRGVFLLLLLIFIFPDTRVIFRQKKTNIHQSLEYSKSTKTNDFCSSWALKMSRGGLREKHGPGQIKCLSWTLRPWGKDKCSTKQTVCDMTELQIKPNGHTHTHTAWKNSVHVVRVSVIKV